MENMEFWGRFQDTPEEARKPIQAGRLKGMTDINPMWRFKMLTQVFGPCGIGWKYEIVNKWLEKGLDNEIKAFVEVNLYIAVDKVWSAAIPGVGGSSFVTVERNGPYCSDECYKMALTDAISVCCKALGMSADIYFEKDRDKYTAGDAGTQETRAAPPADKSRPYNGEGSGPAPGRQTRMNEAPANRQEGPMRASAPTGNTGTGAICSACGCGIPDNVAAYSSKYYGRPLCRECQSKARTGGR